MKIKTQVAINFFDNTIKYNKTKYICFIAAFQINCQDKVKNNQLHLKE